MHDVLVVLLGDVGLASVATVDDQHGDVNVEDKNDIEDKNLHVEDLQDLSIVWFEDEEDAECRLHDDVDAKEDPEDELNGDAGEPLGAEAVFRDVGRCLNA